MPVRAGDLAAFRLDEPASAVGTVDPPLRRHAEIDQWMAKRTAAAVAPDDILVDIDGLERLHGPGFPCWLTVLSGRHHTAAQRAFNRDGHRFLAAACFQGRD